MLPVLEAIEECIRDLGGEIETVRTPADLEQPEGRFEQEGMLVEVGEKAGAADLPGGVEAALRPLGVPSVPPRRGRFAVFAYTDSKYEMTCSPGIGRPRKSRSCVSRGICRWMAVAAIQQSPDSSRRPSLWLDCIARAHTCASA